MIKVVEVYDKVVTFEKECNDLLAEGYIMIPNSFNIINKQHMNSVYI